MNNFIKKMGFTKHYWFGMITPPIAVFSLFALEDTAAYRELSDYVQEHFLNNAFPGSLVIGLVIMLIGVVLPTVLLGRIRCPNCKTRIMLSFLKQGGEFNNPSILQKCPKCDFDPSE